MNVFLISNKRGINASGEYDPNTKLFIVKKGSKVSPTVSQAPTFRSARTVSKYREQYVQDNIVIEDVIFKSASSAANFVTGSSTDGTRAWKDRDGKSIASTSKKTEVER